MRVALALLAFASATQADARARDLGVPFEGTPGPLTAITDIRGVEVGQNTLIRGDGPLKLGVGPVRTGVTVVFPRGHKDPLFEASTQATEEAIVNALIAAKTMTGANGRRYFGLPHNELRAILRRYNRLEASK